MHLEIRGKRDDGQIMMPADLEFRLDGVVQEHLVGVALDIRERDIVTARLEFYPTEVTVDAEVVAYLTAQVDAAT